MESVGANPRALRPDTATLRALAAALQMDADELQRRLDETLERLGLLRLPEPGLSEPGLWDEGILEPLRRAAALALGEVGDLADQLVRILKEKTTVLS